MKCEYCGRWIYGHEVAHGLRYGSIDGAHGVFLPARESAWTVICSSCGEKVFRTVYAALDKSSATQSYPIVSRRSR